MKKTILFACFLLLAAICFGQDNSPTIGLGAAWSHCAATSSYWFTIGGVLVASGVLILVLSIVAKKVDLNPWLLIIVRLVIAAAILISVLWLPCDMAVNTTVNMAAQGIYIR